MYAKSRSSSTSLTVRLPLFNSKLLQLLVPPTKKRSDNNDNDNDSKKMGCQASRPAQDVLEDSLHKIRVKAKKLEMMKETLNLGADDDSVSSSVDTATKETLRNLKRQRSLDRKKRGKYNPHYYLGSHSDTASSRD